MAAALLNKMHAKRNMAAYIAVLTLSILLSVALGYADWMMDRIAHFDVSFTVFYIIPVGLAAWFSGTVEGFIVAVLASSAVYTADINGSSGSENAFVPVWNAFAGMLFFFSFVSLLAIMKKEIRMQKQLAREDFLTKASNGRAFYNYANIEMSRIARYNSPLTLVYLDIDNFKEINDSYGHPEGDRLLVRFVGAIRANIRLTDAVARLGGDEFAILLPEMGAGSAESFVAHIRQAIEKEMKATGGPVTFSAGVVTFEKPPHDPGEMIKIADNLMYEVKKSGKDSIKYMVYR
jgi:diguanylate cyclase (GGDEF)-like protein